MNDIGWAIKQLWAERTVHRSGWSDNAWLELIADERRIYLHVGMDQPVPWICSQEDLLTMDWDVADN